MILTIIYFKVNDYIYTRNLYKELYPPEADSISIPIMNSLLITVVIFVLIFPVVVFGSKRIKNWISSRAKYSLIPIYIILILSYFIGFFLILGLFLGTLNKNHWEISIAASPFIAYILYFLVNDLSWVLKNDRYKKLNSEKLDEQTSK